MFGEDSGSVNNVFQTNIVKEMQPISVGTNGTTFMSAREGHNSSPSTLNSSKTIINDLEHTLYDIEYSEEVVISYNSGVASVAIVNRTSSSYQVLIN